MDQSKRLKTSSNLYRPERNVRPSSLSRILGRDWKMAIPFVLPIVIIMGGLIL